MRQLSEQGIVRVFAGNFLFTLKKKVTNERNKEVTNEGHRHMWDPGSPVCAGVRSIAVLIMGRRKMP